MADRSELETALAALSAAHGPAALAQAHQALQRAVKRSRQDPAAGVLSQTIAEALRQRDAQKMAGASQAELEANLEATVRACWPVRRAWQYLCQSCGDYGLVMHECPGDATCGRSSPHQGHDYGDPCWCDKGRRYRGRVQTEATTVEAAATKRPRPPTRFGR